MYNERISAPQFGNGARTLDHYCIVTLVVSIFLVINKRKISVLSFSMKVRSMFSRILWKSNETFADLSWTR